jgi:AraC-like DNA-binding protein
MLHTSTVLPAIPEPRLAAAGSFDVLSYLLRVVRLSGAALFRGDLSAPWAVKTVDSTKLAHIVLPKAKRPLLFHLVAEGHCWIALPDCHRVQLACGDIAVLPYGDAHTMGCDGGHEPVPVAGLLRDASWNTGLPVVVHGGGGETTRIICGFVHCDELLFNPLLKTLPALLHMNTEEEPAESLLAGSVRHLIGEAQAARAGSTCLLARLSELLLVEVLRRHMTALPPETVGWLSALNDPLVGRALQLLHADPAHGWTVNSLARKVGASRSSLATRFKTLLGQPPMRYLTYWRLQLAAELLRDGAIGMAALAASVGYDSEAAFNRAFKRYTGEPPTAWRNRAASETACSPGNEWNVLDGPISRCLDRAQAGSQIASPVGKIQRPDSPRHPGMVRVDHSTVRLNGEVARVE